MDRIRALTVFVLGALALPASGAGIVVTTTADFRQGNNEGMVSFDLDAVSRAAPTGGRLGSWGVTTSFPTGRYKHASVAYNGYLYVIGGWSEAHAPLADVRVAPILANGTVGPWSATTAMPAARYGHQAVAYNGFLYVLGGGDGTEYWNDVIVAPINANGTLGAWVTTASFATGRYYHGAVACNGYMYLVGGSGAGGILSDVQYAAIRPNGRLSTWFTAALLPGPRTYGATLAYDGKLYIVGGYDGTTFLNEVRFAVLGPTGAVGSWVATTGFPSLRSTLHAVAHDGYLYVMGGWSDTVYAPIHASGRVGEWATTTTYATRRGFDASAAYDGYVFITGGQVGSTWRTDVQAAPFRPNGTAGTWAPTTSMPAARAGHSAVAYDGRVYVMGGYDGAAYSSAVRFAPIAIDGTLGAWAATTSLPVALGSHASAAWNGVMFVVGGDAGAAPTAVVRSAPIGAGGALGAWTETTPLPAGRSDHALAVWGDALYVLGGTDGAAPMADVTFAPLAGGGTVGPWAATTSLPSARRGHAAAAYGDHLWVLGGTDGAGALSDVQGAAIQPGGTLGAWAPTQAFTGARWGHAAVASNGYMYVIGGTDGASLFTDVQVAWIQAGGALGAWSATGDVATARESHAAAAYDGRLYVIGGHAASWLSDAQVAATHADGTLDPWSATTSLGSTRQDLAAAATDRFLYASGGYDGAAERGDVDVAALASDGTAGAWTATAPLVPARRGHTLLAAGGYLYAIGGTSGGTPLADVRYAAIALDGTLGAWTATSSLPSGRAWHAAAAADGYVYVVGGADASGVLALVVAAPVQPDGSLGAWVAGTSLPAGRRAHAAAAYRGQLYVLGGDDGGNDLDDVLVAPLSSGGAVGPWTPAARFDIPRRSFAMGVSNGYIYIAGGFHGGSPLDDVQSAPLLSDGAIGSWSEVSELTAPVGEVAGAVANGYLYAVAGSNGADPSAVVRTATLRGPACRARYSKLVDASINVRMDSVRFLDTGQRGITNLTYVTAPSANPIFGQRTTIANAESGIDYTTNLGSCARWIWIAADLDDRASATVDSGGTLGRGDLLEIQITYGSGVGATPSILGVKSAVNARMTWQAISGATSYTVRRCDATSGPCTLATIGSTTNLYWDDPVLGDGRSYWYQIDAVVALCP